MTITANYYVNINNLWVYSAAQPPKFSHSAVGTIYNKNTIEEFKALDKNALLANEGKRLLADMKSGNMLKDTSLLARFFVLSFADLKSHSYYYWFAFPCPLTPTLKLHCDPLRLKDLSNSASYIEVIRTLPAEKQNFFILYANEEEKQWETRCLSNFDEQESQHYYYCFADPTEYENLSYVWIHMNVCKCNYLTEGTQSILMLL